MSLRKCCWTTRGFWNENTGRRRGSRRGVSSHKNQTLQCVHNVFTVPDADGVIAAIVAGKKTVVVVGGGFIGLEMAENLVERGLKTILIERLRQRYTELDPAKTYVVYCAVGYRAYNACRFLGSKNFKTYNMCGGYRAYTMTV